MFRKLVPVIAVMIVFAAALVIAPSVSAGANACDRRVNNTFAKLLECVTLDGVREHQAAFQSIADANGGTRAAGTPGYEASLQYVVDRLAVAGYQMTLDSRFGATLTAMQTSCRVV